MVSLLRTLRDHADEVSCCAFSAALLASCSGDKTLRVYATAGFSELPYSPLSGHGYGVHCCSFSSCGRYLLSCSTDGSAIVWRSDTGETAAAFLHPARSPLRACALAPDSSLVLAGACDGTVALWDFTSKTLRRNTDELLDSARAFDLDQGSAKRVWMRGTSAEGHSCSYVGSNATDGCCVEFRLASCGQDSRLKIWIVSQRDGAVCTMKLLHILASQSAPVLSCAFSCDGDLVVSGSVDKSVAVYDANLGSLLHTLKQHDRYVTAVALSPTMPWIATGSMDRTVNVWSIGNGDSIHGAELTQTACQGRKLPGHSRLLLADWSEEDVWSWLCEEGLGELVSVFKAHNIDGAELSQLNKEVAAELGIESVGLRGRLLRKIEALKVEQSDSETPDEFLCPITRELTKDPVIAADGYSYERESIESWIRGKNKTSPMTNLPLQTTLLTSNRSLKMAITRWRTSQ